MQMNYAYAAEVFEGTHGSFEEQKKVKMELDQWGLHGQAIYTPFQITAAERGVFPDHSEYLDLGGENRFGLKGALFAHIKVSILFIHSNFSLSHFVGRFLVRTDWHLSQ